MSPPIFQPLRRPGRGLQTGSKTMRDWRSADPIPVSPAFGALLHLWFDVVQAIVVDVAAFRAVLDHVGEARVPDDL